MKELSKIDFNMGKWPTNVQALKKYQLAQTKHWKISEMLITSPSPLTDDGTLKVVIPKCGLHLVHLDMWKVIESLFEDNEHAINSFWRYENNENVEGEKAFSELNTGNWWKQMNSAHPDKDILAVILASDGCQVTIIHFYLFSLRQHICRFHSME